MSNFILTSNSFEDGGIIPRKFGYKHGNCSPLLKIDNVPEGAKSLALIMDDPDAMGPAGKIWVHWIVYNIDPKSEFKENKIPSESIEGKTDFGEIGYGGPAPPDKEHTYIFKLYALDQKFNTQDNLDKKQLEELIRDHIISETKLTGRFAP